VSRRTARSAGNGFEEGVSALAERNRLDAAAAERLRRLSALLSSDPLAPTAIRQPHRVLNDHLADSLVALERDEMRGARLVLDLGAGAGLPGLPLAIALPEVEFALLEGSSRKCRFMEGAVQACELTNVEVVHARAESMASLRDRFDVVTARAVAPLAVTAEYAAPLLRVGGMLLAWHGRRDPDADAVARAAAHELGLGGPTIHPVHPYPGAEHRHLYAFEKVTETASRFPRRPGMALKRPLGRRSPV
jgi:16S rRNA (guanine527-N7)-methyltransferase